MVTEWQGLLETLQSTDREVSLRAGTVQLGWAGAQIKAVSLTEEHIGKSCFSFAGLVWFWLPGCCPVGYCLPEDAKNFSYLFILNSFYCLYFISTFWWIKSVIMQKILLEISRSFHSFIWPFGCISLCEKSELHIQFLALTNKHRACSPFHQDKDSRDHKSYRTCLVCAQYVRVSVQVEVMGFSSWNEANEVWSRPSKL